MKQIKSSLGRIEQADSPKLQILQYYLQITATLSKHQQNKFSIYMEIEPLTIHNLRHLTELVSELWDDCEIEEELENYKKIINSENEVCYLGKMQENYIAFVHVSIRHDYVEGATDLPVAYVEGIYVKPNYQKQGIAKKIMIAAEDWARQKGFKQLASDTLITNQAGIDFHKKVGFNEVERIVCFIKDI